MKNIKYLFILLFVSFFAASCEEDLDIVVMPEEQVVVAPQFADGQPSTVVLSADTPDDVVATFSWSAADSDYNGNITYYLVVGKVGEEFDFATAEVLDASTADLTLELTHEQMNLPLLNLGVAAGTATDVELRVMASLNIDKNFAFSTPVTVNVTPYEMDMGEVELAKMYMVGGYDVLGGWTPTEAAEMLAHDADEDGVVDYYDACLYLDVNNGFKFIDAQADWGEVTMNLGLAKDADENPIDDGTVINSGESTDIKVAEDGFYYVWLDVANMQYKYVKMEWGVIGATTGWSNELPLTYDETAGAYKGSVTIPADEPEWKLRSSNTGIAIYGEDGAWKYNFGPGSETIHDAGVPNYPDTGDLNLTFTVGFQCEATLTIE